jgi:hypothetical protein
MAESSNRDRTRSVAVNFAFCFNKPDPCRFQVSGVRFQEQKKGFRCQPRRWPEKFTRLRRAASLILKETPAWQMSNVDWRIKEFFLFYLLKEQSEATSTIRQSSIFIRHSMKSFIPEVQGSPFRVDVFVRLSLRSFQPLNSEPLNLEPFGDYLSIPSQSLVSNQ